MSQLCFSMGFGAATLFYGDGQHPPRLQMSNGFLEEDNFALSVCVPDQPADYVATVNLGDFCICRVITRDDGVSWAYEYEAHHDDCSLLTAQLSAMVHEAVEAKANHNPSDYAGIILLGV